MLENDSREAQYLAYDVEVWLVGKSCLEHGTVILNEVVIHTGVSTR